jgi:hypothetical protein
MALISSREQEKASPGIVSTFSFTFRLAFPLRFRSRRNSHKQRHVGLRTYRVHHAEPPRHGQKVGRFVPAFRLAGAYRGAAVMQKKTFTKWVNNQFEQRKLAPLSNLVDGALCGGEEALTNPR